MENHLGDAFRVEIDSPEEVLLKALMKKTASGSTTKKTSVIGLLMFIGIGEKTFSGNRISESNGPAFIFAGEKFEKLKKEKTNMAIQSPWPDFDNEINLYLKLLGIITRNVLQKW